MKKVILKSALITLAAIIAVALIVYGVFAFFFPASLASGYRGVSNYSVALKYSERAYRKNGDYNALLIVVNDAIDSENAEKITEYAEKALLNRDLSSSERCRISESYCLALYEYNYKNYSPKLVFERALNVAAQTVGEPYYVGYVEGNPLRSLLMACVNDCNELLTNGKTVSAEKAQYLNLINQELCELAKTQLPSAQKTLLNNDITMLGEFISRVQK